MANHLERLPDPARGEGRQAPFQSPFEEIAKGVSECRCATHAMPALRRFRSEGVALYEKIVLHPGYLAKFYNA